MPIVASAKLVPASYLSHSRCLGSLETPSLLSPATLLFLFFRDQADGGPFHHKGLATLHCSSSLEVRLVLSEPLLPCSRYKQPTLANNRFRCSYTVKETTKRCRLLSPPILRSLITAGDPRHLAPLLQPSDTVPTDQTVLRRAHPPDYSTRQT